MEKETYNGWTNYATWRVNLELVDGTDWSDMSFEDVYALSQYIKEMVEEVIGVGTIGSEKDIVLSYAMAFVADVNWYEIAQHIADDNENLVKKQ